MTNKEYIIKNNISFAEAMKKYDSEKYPSIEAFLEATKIDKFKVGDIIVNAKGGHGFWTNVITGITDDNYITMAYHPDGSYEESNIKKSAEHQLMKIGEAVGV